MIDLYNKYKEIINYLIFGVLTTLISLATYYALTFTVLNADKALELQIANIVSWIVSVTFAYFTNRSFVFASKQKLSLKEAFSFYMSRVSTLLLDMGLMYLLVTVLSFNDKLVKIIVQVIVIVLNYVLSKFIVFKKK